MDLSLFRTDVKLHPSWKSSSTEISAQKTWTFDGGSGDPSSIAPKCGVNRCLTFGEGFMWSPSGRLLGLELPHIHCNRVCHFFPKAKNVFRMLPLRKSSRKSSDTLSCYKLGNSFEKFQFLLLSGFLLPPLSHVSMIWVIPFKPERNSRESIIEGRESWA